MDETTAGIECFYSAESIRLAATWGALLPAEPWWISTTPSVHLEYADQHHRQDLLARLLEKYRRLLTNPLAAPHRTEMWVDLMTALLGLPVTPEGVDSTDRAYLTGWEATANSRRRMEALETALTEIFTWTSKSSDPSGAGALRLWYITRCVALARRGGYANPAANDTNPHMHRSWVTTASPIAIIRDLADKSQEQFDRLHTKGKAALVRFSAEMLSRSASWGGSLGDSLQPAVTAAWTPICESWLQDGSERLRERLDRMLRDTGSLLLSRGRHELGERDKPWLRHGVSLRNVSPSPIDSICAAQRSNRWLL